MDIRKHAVLPTGRLHLRDASDELMVNDDGEPVAVNVFGPGSKQFVKAKTNQNNRALDRMRRKGKADQTPEQKTADTAEFLAEVTESFENLDYDDLKDKALYLAVYSDPELGYIVEQLDKFLGDWSNFKKPSTSS